MEYVKMAKVLSFLSWNVENFHNEPGRINRVVDLIAEKSPDIFAIYEVKGSAVFNAMVTKMPRYTFSITESPGVPEILVGVRNNLTAFVTQKDELQSKVPSLRPGALATVNIDQVNYSFLFLHLKSFPQPRDWGLRDDMFQHVAHLKRALDKQMPSGQKSNFVALGDLNTMGLKAAYNKKSDMTGTEELAFVDKRMTAAVNGMRRLPKTCEDTWWNGKDNQDPSSLDHVFASEHLAFRSFSDGAEVEVSGWVNQPTVRQKRDWINKFSDHSLMYCEIHD
jgi:exonuclease III